MGATDAEIILELAIDKGALIFGVALVAELRTGDRHDILGCVDICATPVKMGTHNLTV